MAEPCKMCPRQCGALRTDGERGECGAGKELEIASLGKSVEEESPLGKAGMIFFPYCNMHCVYCQNYEISRGKLKKIITIKELIEIMLGFQSDGCDTIDLVTPTHYATQIAEAVLTARKRGLDIPVVYNSSGYDSVETLKLLDGVIDIYLPDLKYMEDINGLKYSRVSGYPRIAKQAIKEMHRQVGDLFLDNKGKVAVQGLIIRHLVLPNGIAGTEKAMKFIANDISPYSSITIMQQYFPTYLSHFYPEINRAITEQEYQDALTIALDISPNFNLIL